MPEFIMLTRIDQVNKDVTKPVLVNIDEIQCVSDTSEFTIVTLVNGKNIPILEDVAQVFLTLGGEEQAVEEEID